MTGPHVPACVACWATGTPCGDPRHDADVIPPDLVVIENVRADALRGAA